MYVCTMVASFDRPILCPVVIGRMSNLVAAYAVMERAKEHEGQIVLLSGEAGIGKSRLAAEIKTYAISQGFQSLQGNCFPTDLACPYAPLLDLFHAHFASAASTTIVAEIAPFARELFPLLPSNADLLQNLATLPPLPALEPEQEKRRLFSAITHFFLQKAAERPILLIIEDLHWCDDLSLEFLHYLARRCVEQSVMLLFTYRNDEVRPELGRWLAQLDRARLAQEFPLVCLPRSSVDAMLNAMLGLPPPLRKKLLETIHTLTEGNPFFVEETLKSLIETGQLVYKDGVWEQHLQGELRIPRSVQDMLQQRTARLSEGARQVLRLAAVAGRRFNFVLLQHLSGFDERQLLLLMKELIEAQLVIEESADQFAFRHALTRQAIYTGLLGRERRKLHGSIAEMMEQIYSSELDSHLADISVHFYEAEAWSKALMYARQAGERALALHAPESAIEHFSRAIDANQRLTLDTPLTLYRARGQAYETQGKFEEARSDYELTLELAQAQGDQRAEWQSLIDLGSLWSERDYMRGGAYHQDAMRLAQVSGDRILVAHSLNRIGNWYLNREQPHEAVKAHQEALAIFQQRNEQQGIAETLDLLGMACYLGGDLTQSKRYYEQAIPLFRQQENQTRLASVLATLIMCGGNYQTETLLSVTMDSARIIHQGELALHLTQEVGQRSGEAYALMNMGFALGRRGEYGRALACLMSGLELAEEINHRQWMAGTRCALGAFYHDVLLLSEAQQHLEQAAALAREIGSQFWLNIAIAFLASLYIDINNLKEAEKHLKSSLGATTPTRTIGQRMLWYASVRLAIARHDPQKALHIINQLLAAVSSVEGEVQVPRLLYLRASAFQLLKQNSEAEKTLQAAQIAAFNEGMQPLLWRIYLDQSKLYSSQRRHEEAERVLAAGQQIVYNIAATITNETLREGYVNRAKALLTRTHPLTTRRADKLAFEGLTAREREIASLIAQGKSNREIAEMLILSDRTVETHVSNIMLKLGFTSRHQIILWAVKKGLPTES